MSTVKARSRFILLAALAALLWPMAAGAMVLAAQHNGTVLSTCSAMRFDKALMELVAELDNGLGRPRIVTVCCPCYQDLARYSVHGIEIMLAVLRQPPVVRVRIFKKALNGEFVPGHYEDFQISAISELAEQIEKYIQAAVGKNIREYDMGQ